MSHQQFQEHFESSLGSGNGSTANLDGGSILGSANLSDMNTRPSGPTHLHNIDFSDSGSGIAATRDIRSGDDNSSEININFKNITLSPEHGGAWSFMKTSHEESLHDKISDKVKEGMDPKDRTELDKEEKAYEKSFKNWSTMVGIGIKPPGLDDYPMLKQHLQKVSEVEKGITHRVMEGLSPTEKGELEHESDPLGPGFAPKPMHDEVTKRIREATRKYLEPNK